MAKISKTLSEVCDWTIIQDGELSLLRYFITAAEKFPDLSVTDTRTLALDLGVKARKEELHITLEEDVYALVNTSGTSVRCETKGKVRVQLPTSALVGENENVHPSKRGCQLAFLTLRADSLSVHQCVWKNHHDIIYFHPSAEPFQLLSYESRDITMLPIRLESNFVKTGNKIDVELWANITATPSNFLENIQIRLQTPQLASRVSLTSCCKRSTLHRNREGKVKRKRLVRT